MSQPTVTFITIASNSYWLGFAALVESIRANSGLQADNYRFIAYSSSEIPDFVSNWANKRSESIEFRVGQELNDFISKSPQKYERLNESIKKIGLIGIQAEPNTRYVFIDSDIICLNSLSGIYQYKPFAGVPNSQNYFAEINESVDVDHINGGFFIFEPSIKDRDELFSMYNEEPAKFTRFGDQDLLQAWNQKHNCIQFMPTAWNCQKGIIVPFEGKPKYSLLDTVRLLHFTGENPWEYTSTIKLNEGRYLKLEKMWWKYYTNSGIIAPVELYGQLSVKVAYKRFFRSRMNYLQNRLSRMLGKLKK